MSKPLTNTEIDNLIKKMIKSRVKRDIELSENKVLFPTPPIKFSPRHGPWTQE